MSLLNYHCRGHRRRRRRHYFKIALIIRSVFCSFSLKKGKNPLADNEQSNRYENIKKTRMDFLFVQREIQTNYLINSYKVKN